MFGRWILLIALILLVSCQKEAENSIEIWGHAGTGLQRMDGNPDNSLEAIKKAWYKYKVSGIEVDIQMSKDGTLWLYHDEYLESKTSGTGCISEMNDEYLSEVKYYDKPGLHINIPLTKLEDALKIAPHQAQIMLDIRTVNFCKKEQVNFNEVIDQIVTLKEKYEHIQFYIATFSDSFLQICKNKGLDNLFLESINITEDKGIIVNNSYRGTVIKNNNINKEQVQSLKDLGIEVMIFEVRSLAGFNIAKNKNPNQILSDHLKIVN